MRVRLAVKSLKDTQFELAAYLKALLSVTLENRAGPMRMRKVKFIVFDEEMDEVLLSQPLLSSIGIDINGRLENVQRVYHDVDFSSAAFYPGLSENDTVLSQSPSTLAEVMLEAKDNTGEAVLFRYHIGPEEWLEESPDHTELPIAGHHASAVNEALQTMVKKAVKEGLPSQMETS